MYIKVVLVVASIWCLALQAEAQSRSALQALVLGKSSSISRYIPSSSNTNRQTYAENAYSEQNDLTLRLAAAVPGLGRVKFIFTTLIFHPDQASFVDASSEVADSKNVTLLQGRLESKTQRGPVAAAIYLDHETHKIHISFVEKSRKRQSDKMYRISIPITAAASGSVSRVPASIVKNKSCATAHTERAQEQSTAAVKKQRVLTTKWKEVLSVRLGIVSDYEWFQRYGALSNIKVKELINIADALYFRQLGIKLNLVSLTTVKVPHKDLRSTDADRLLTTFRRYLLESSALPAVDVFHLFTGKLMDDDVLGIAVIGSVCLASWESTGVVESVGSDLGSAIIFAHELGHNLGALHDRYYGRVMGAVLGEPYPRKFSSRSIREIRAFLGEFGTCLAHYP